MKITVEHNDKTYYGKVAKVTSTQLGWEDHGILTAFLTVSGNGWGTSVGGFCLDEPVKDSEDYRRVGTSYGLDHVMQFIRTVGVSNWEDITGKDVIVLYEKENPLGSVSKGIASIDGERVFILKEHADIWRGRDE